MNIENILVPTDFSQSAENALSFAAKIAEKFNARIFLMHTASSAYTYISMDRLNKQISDERFKDLDIRTLVEIGNPGPSILKQIDVTSADLIVMGNKGRSGARILFGSTTSKIISDSPVPVMTIPEQSSLKDLKQIVFATDYHSGDLSSLKKTIGWAQKFNSELHVLHVSPSEETNPDLSFRDFKGMVEEQTDYKKLIFNRIANESFLKGFSNYLDEFKVSLVVLTKYKKSFIEEIMEKNHTKQIQFYLNIPLLVLNNSE